MTRVWRNNQIGSEGNNQSEFLTCNSCPNNQLSSKAESDLDNDNDLKSYINLDEVDDTDLRNGERLENQDALSNVKIFIKDKQDNKRQHKQRRNGLT
jgi:hypothetical protein